MPAPFDFEDVRLFWVEDPDLLSLKSFELPSATICASFNEALEMVQASTETERRPWIQVDGVLFGPAHLGVLIRRIGRKQVGLTLIQPERSDTSNEIDP